jgi:3-oxoacyl-(acyl-carrier-protein) reductase
MARVAVVTGGTRGIGAAVSNALKAAGCEVAATYHSNNDAAAKFKAETGVDVYKWNVAKYEDCVAGLAQVAKDLGPVDILVNNAGITKDGLLMRMSEADWDAVLDINLKGTFLFTKAFSRSFLKQQSGRIINIASVIGLIGNAGQCNYGASKAGVIGFTKSAARELASRGITVNAIAPGFIETAMTAKISPEARAALLKQIPLGSLGQPDDVAEAVLFLASPAARYITGQVLAVDGGMAM